MSVFGWCVFLFASICIVNFLPRRTAALIAARCSYIKYWFRTLNFFVFENFVIYLYQYMSFVHWISFNSDNSFDFTSSSTFFREARQPRFQSLGSILYKHEWNTWSRHSVKEVNSKYSQNFRWNPERKGTEFTGFELPCRLFLNYYASSCLVFFFFFKYMHLKNCINIVKWILANFQP